MNQRRTLFGLSSLLACAVAWLQLDGLSLPARAWAVFLLVPLPILMILQARLLSEETELPRTPAYLSSILSLWLLAIVTAAIVYAGDIGRSAIGLRALPWSTLVLHAGGLTAAGVAVLFGFRIAGFREAATLRQLLPETTAERLLFVAVSASAGICEELIYRGFLLTVLTHATGSPVIAAAVSSGAFGIVHAYQRPIGALRAALLGVLLASSVIATGSLYPAIIAHTAMDVLSGLWLARYLLR